MDASTASQYWYTRFYFQRALGFIYTVGFFVAINQFRALCGDHGILPVRLFLKRITFWDSPSLFFLNSSDSFVMIVAYLGLGLAFLALTGLSDAYGNAISYLVWFLLWLIYLSFVNVGQTFYGFGWETLLLEAGFLTLFLGSSHSKPSVIVIWLLRWILFRLMFGAGLIKLRGDECWRDLTCMEYHYETQPMPNPLSWYFHHLPELILRGAVLVNHFVELVVPFFVFAPRPFRHIAGLIIIIFQGLLILSGNLSWLNYLTIVLCISCFDDSILPKLSLWTENMGLRNIEIIASGVPTPLLYALTFMVLFLSVNPVKNLFSRNQMMNTSFEPLHLVNTYGAFGSITRTRYEIIMEGTLDPYKQKWEEYEFKGKPGDISRIPPLVAPYHLRLGWLMWFAAMSSYEDYPWILSLTGKLLQGDKDVLALMGKNPFPDHPPQFIRASLYEYHFTDRGEKNTWNRTFVRSYLPELSLDNPQFHNLLEEEGWL